MILVVSYTYVITSSPHTQTMISDMRLVRVFQCAPKLCQGAPSLSQGAPKVFQCAPFITKLHA